MPGRAKVVQCTLWRPKLLEGQSPILAPAFTEEKPTMVVVAVQGASVLPYLGHEWRSGHHLRYNGPGEFNVAARHWPRVALRI